jgi:small-conductance mechanosensitive channel
LREFVLAEGLIVTLIEQLRSNLGDTLSAFGAGDVNWSAVAAYVIGQVLVSLVYLVLFVGSYWLLMVFLRALAGPRRVQSIMFVHVQTALRYVTGLSLLLAILAQFGAGPMFLAASAKAGFIALAFYVAWLVSERLLHETMSRYNADPSIWQLVRNLFSVLLFTFAAITVLAQFGFDVVSIVAGLGIVGIAVGFAAQSTLSNFIAGITLLIERPFRIGDWVNINGQDGKVVKIALRTTWLRTRDNIFAMIPNDSVASSDIINFSAEGVTRLNLSVGIAYKESIVKAREVILPVLLAHKEVLQTESLAPRVMVESLSASSVDLKVQVWITPDNLDVQPRIIAELRERVKQALDDAGIEIPFPHLQLFIDGAPGLKPLLEPWHPAHEQNVQGE